MGPRLFPAYFGAVVHPFFAALLPMEADERVAAVLAAFPRLQHIMQPAGAGRVRSRQGRMRSRCGVVWGAAVMAERAGRERGGTQAEGG